MDNFADQLAFIAHSSPAGAALVRNRVLDAIARLAAAPTGRMGRKRATFEKYVAKTSLIIVYALPDKATLTVVRIIHASRDFGEGSWPE